MSSVNTSYSEVLKSPAFRQGLDPPSSDGNAFLDNESASLPKHQKMQRPSNSRNTGLLHGHHQETGPDRASNLNNHTAFTATTQEDLIGADQLTLSERDRRSIVASICDQQAIIDMKFKEKDADRRRNSNQGPH